MTSKRLREYYKEQRRKSQEEQAAATAATLKRFAEWEKREEEEEAWVAENKVRSVRPDNAVGFHYEGDEIVWEIGEPEEPMEINSTPPNLKDLMF